MFYSGVEIKMKIEIKVMDILNLKNLKRDLIKAENYNEFLTQIFIDTVEEDRQDIIGVMFKENCIKIKALNKRIILLTRYIQKGF